MAKSIEIPFDFSNRIANKILFRHEVILLDQYKIALENIRKDISILYSKFSKSGILISSDAYKFNRLGKVEQDIVKVMNDLLKSTDIVIESSINKTFKGVYKSDEYILNIGSNRNFDFSGVNKEKISEILNGTADKIKWPARHIKNMADSTARVQSTLIQGIASNKTYTQISKDLASEMGISFRKAKRIIRTEGHRSQESAHDLSRNQIANDIREDNQTIVKKIWDSIIDKLTREQHNHGGLDGQKRLYDKNFTYGSYKAMFPGSFGVAKMDINCRCTTRTIIDNPEFSFDDTLVSFNKLNDYIGIES